MPSFSSDILPISPSASEISTFDTRTLFDYSPYIWPSHDFFYLIGRALFSTVKVIGPLPDRPAVYVTNHQICFDLPFLSAILATRFHQHPVTFVWNDIWYLHPNEFIGRLVEHFGSEINAKIPTIAIDFYDPADVLKNFQRVEQMVKTGNASPVLAAEGRLEYFEGEPLQQVSGAIIDLALRGGIDVRPVRFSGGLPALSQGQKFALPHRLAPMDITMGPPISPRDLADLTPVARKTRIIEALNALRGSTRPRADRTGESYERVLRLQDLFGVSRTKALLADQLILADPTRLSPDVAELRRCLLDSNRNVPFDRRSDLYRFFLWMTDGLMLRFIPLSEIYGSRVIP